MIQRIRSKILRETRKRSWNNIPRQEETTFIENDTEWLSSILSGPTTFIHDSMSAETIAKVIDISQKLTIDKWSKFTIEFYQEGLRRFGDNWKYADLNTVLYSICKNINVRSYLEIGVRCGRSMCIVTAMNPHVEIVAFDMWIKGYAGMNNPGPDFVKIELKKVGYSGNVEFVNGNSRKTVPLYLKNNPDAYFDLITVDGDHSISGAKIDLKNVIPRLKIGGFLVFDDICNPYHPGLKKAWKKLVGNNKRFMSFTFDEAGYGVGFGIKLF